ncbi:hypothetical protein [Rugosimonospora africana]|uniref:Uncharacterized protein n=1 Tax=Rugosimonospora africana TaxID=556532 RepID=A0A8J3QWA0_9ACTN|nr:hypothetical protein [Rugosimonospora africana]GIH17701.1 hypothetical protein Raf01_58730 [Rugosimonospora africana]
MVTTEQGPPHNAAQQQVRGLPAWYFVLAGLLVASFDISQQFRSNYPLVAALPLVLLAVHITLWFVLLSRRRQYIRSVWRSPQARLLVVLLFGVRLLLQLVLTRMADGAAPLHTYAHLIMALALLVLTTTGAWFDQWLILRTVNKRTEQTKERQR